MDSHMITTADDLSRVTVKTEEKVAIKREVIETEGNLGPSVTDSVASQQGNILEFKEEESAFIKPEPGSFAHGPMRFKDDFLLLSEFCNDDKNVNAISIQKFCLECNSAIDQSGQEDSNGVVAVLCANCYEGGASISSRGRRSRSEEQIQRNAVNGTEGFICGQCDRVFANGRNLKRHLVSVHEKLKRFVCEQCDHAFTQRANLKKHINSVHRKLKKYECGECDNAFARQDHLKQHLDNVHRKLKKFVCGECDRAFSQRGYIIQHIEIVHRKIKKFICPKCDRAFSQKGSLKSHIDSFHKKSRKVKKYVCAT